MKRRKSAVLCDHANEVPAVCKCPSDCYCKSHTCKPKAGTADPERYTVPTLKAFFKRVARLTLDHKICNDRAVVYAIDLDDALKKVDPKWLEHLHEED